MIKIVAYLISLSLIFMNTFSSLLKGRKRLVKWLLLLFMWILFWGNYENADYIGYLRVYNAIQNIDFGDIYFEIGFVLLMKLAASIGLNYNQFLMIFSFVGLTLIALSVEKESPKPYLVYALYFIYPFFLDIVQIRFFLATSIVVYSFRYLAYTGKRGILKYITGIMLASAFHISALLFVVLVFVKWISARRLFFISVFICVTGIMLAYGMRLGNLFMFIFPSRAEAYLLTRARFGYLLPYTIQGICLFLVFYSRHLLIRKGIASNFIEIVYKANAFSLVFFPLYIINGNFFRFYRVLMIPNYIVFSIALVNSKTRRRPFFLISVILVVIIVAFFFIYLHHKESVFFPIMEKNLVLEMIK